ncbi:hypothetical protein Ddye_001373 [Dipteronia dyeriana]|uniref:PB1 domain-containing protein n=1 Tax=Dipteronia dyeriana TaxID=168575 RepID=A0AAE0CTG4_9ROSI|nr:hypothetical protein Ddye_001373 [Dipteronia dyeriana]
MENYSYNSYPESGESSPRSREIDFENPPPWEDQQNNPQNYKVKFMCSYNGKIHPRPHDNQLAYIGGETKILAVDRNIKFASIISKLSALCGDTTDVSFKYQLPGEDLDALISVTNDDDLDHMMHEYDRLYRTLAKPARMRLFLFPVASPGSFGSDGSKSDRDRFVEALNSGPANVADSKKMSPAPGNHVDFLFGLDKGIPPHKIPEQVAQPPPPPEYHVPDDRVVDPDHSVNPVEIQRHLQRLQIQEQQVQQEAMYMRKSEDNFAAVYAAGGGDYYVPKLPEKAPLANLPASVSQTTAYWPEKQVPSPNYPPPVTSTHGQQEQPMYMISAQGTTMYHAPQAQAPQMIRPVTSQPGQAYYQNMQRMAPGPDVYRDQPVYNMVQTQAPPPTLPSMGMVRSGGGVTDGGYTHVAYDSASGRQVYYTAPGGVVVPQQQYQGVGVAVSGEMRGGGGGGGGGGGLSQEGKVMVNKVSQ